MAKVYIGVGHGGSDCGAVANGFRESDLNLAVSKACYNYLKARGVQVKISRTKDASVWLETRIKEANAFGADLALDIHHNAGGGDGAEVFHTKNGGKGKVLAENILGEMKKIGQNSRGTKVRLNEKGQDYFGFIRQTDMPAVLVECAFIDNKTDLKIVDTAKERQKMGEAIAKAILKTLGIEDIIIKEKKGYTGTFPKLPEKGYLGKGDTGTQVKNLQKFLNWYGGYKLDVDGDFGPKTLEAVKDFQSKTGLDDTGRFGKKSLAKAKTITK